MGDDKLNMEACRLVDMDSLLLLVGLGRDTEGGQSEVLGLLLIKPKISHELLDLNGANGRTLGQNIERLDVGGLEGFIV